MADTTREMKTLASVPAREMAIKSIRKATTREQAERVLDYIIGAVEHQEKNT